MAAIGSGNNFVATDEVGLARGTDEGSGTLSSLATQVSGSLDIAAVVSLLIASPAGLQALATGLAANAIAMQAMAPALISGDSPNSIFITTADGLIAENDSAIF